MPAPQVRRDESNRKERWRHSSNSLLSFLLSLHSHWVTNRQALLMILHLLKLSIECFSFFPLGWFYVSNNFKAPRMHTPAQQKACKVVSDCCFPKEKPWGSNWSNTWNIGPYCKLHLTSLVWTMLGCFGWFLILIKYHCPRWRLMVWWEVRADLAFHQCLFCAPAPDTCVVEHALISYISIQHDNIMRRTVGLMWGVQNITRVRNCPGIPISNSLFGLFLFKILSLNLFAFLSNVWRVLTPKSLSLCPSSKVPLTH